MRSVRLPKDLLLLVPQSPLPQMPRPGQSAMARTTCRRAASGRVLPCGLHLAATGRATGAAESAISLWPSLPRRGRNLVANRRRSKAPRLPDWFSGSTTYLGTKPSSSSTLHCIVPGGGIAPDRRRWISCRRQFLFPVKVLSRVFRGKFIAFLKTAFRDGELGFSR